MFKKLALPLFILTVVIFVSTPFLNPGFYAVHDDQQIARLFLFNKALFAGQFPVRWVDGLGFGFGYPLFIFYPPFVYMFGELLHILGFSFIDSIKLVFVCSILFSGAALYICAKEFFGKVAATVGALFYIMVPYRALDVYVRGALAESFSFVWLPLIIWSYYKLQSERNYSYMVLASVFLALLMITHNLILLPFLLILPFYLLFLLIISKNKKVTVKNFTFSMLIAAGLSAFFWLPSLAEKQFTIVDRLLLINLANYNLHFVYPQQLWNWTWGFGGSAGLQSGISFKIGKIHIILAVMALFFALINFRSLKLKSKFFYLNIYLTILFFAFFIFSAYMTTFYSKFIWDHFQPLQYLQFPWRFLTFTALFSSLLAAAFVYFLRLPILKLTAFVILIIFLFIPNIKLFRPQFYRLDLTDSKATSNSEINWDVSLSSYEYVPNGVELFKNNLGAYMIPVSKETLPKEKVELVNGDNIISNLNSTPTKISFSTKGKTQSLVRVNNFDFPGWQAFIDDQKTEISNNNNLKLITLKVPEGMHKITVKFVNTPIINFANILSVISIIFLVIIPFVPKRKNNNVGI